MISTKNKSIQLQIHPQYFANIYKQIEHQLSSTLKMCYKDDGYILSIDNIKYDNDLVISRTSGHLQIKVNYDVQFIKPNNGDKVTCNIKNIYKEGIFCMYEDLISIFIPSTYLEDWNLFGNMFINKITKNRLCVNDTIECEFISVKYENNSYHCIGKIIV